MKQLANIRLLLAAVLSVALLLTLGCGGTGKVRRPPTWKPAKVAVLPFKRVLPRDDQPGTACSPLTGATFICGSDTPGVKAEQMLTDDLMDFLAQRASFAVVPPRQTQALYRRMSMDRMGEPMAKIVADLGRKLEAQGVLVSHVYRFKNRVGGAYSAGEPASVALDVAMVRVSDGVVIWKNSFDETQQSLTADIFNIGQYMDHGVKWFTAEQFAAIGLEKLMRSFPWQVAPAAMEQ